MQVTTSAGVLTMIDPVLGKLASRVSRTAEHCADLTGKFCAAIEDGTFTDAERLALRIVLSRLVSEAEAFQAALDQVAP